MYTDEEKRDYMKGHFQGKTDKNHQRTIKQELGWYSMLYREGYYDGYYGEPISKEVAF